MKKLQCVLHRTMAIVALTGLSTMRTTAFADVVILTTPQIEAQQRMSQHPTLFDSVDTFCEHKKPDNACSLPGSHFSGGGEGKCTRKINDSTYLIELSCERSIDSVIDRNEPSAGFIDSNTVCRDDAPKADCTPMMQGLADRFCVDKKPNDHCMVELSYAGVAEQDNGVCKVIREKSHYYNHGHYNIERDIMQCQPQNPVTHTYREVGALQKIFQKISD